MKTLDEVVAFTVRRYKGGGGIAELSDTLGIRPSTLYRISNPMDEDAKINSKHLIPLMRATKDYSILKHLAGRLGFILVRLPRVRKKGRNDDMAEYQRLQARAFQQLSDFFVEATSADSTIEALRDELEAATGWMKAVEGHGAPSLFDGGDE